MLGSAGGRGRPDSWVSRGGAWEVPECLGPLGVQGVCKR